METGREYKLAVELTYPLRRIGLPHWNQLQQAALLVGALPCARLERCEDGGFPFFPKWRFQLAGLQIGREVVGAGATADRPADQVVRPGCLGLNSRRRDALTTAPQQETAPHPSIERRAPIRRHLSMMPRNCDALPSTDPDEISTQASGRDLAQSSGWIPLHHIFRRTTGSEVLCWIREGVSPSEVQRRQMWRM